MRGECKGEVGCIFDEISNLVEPNERPDTDVRAGLQRGRTPKRRSTNSPARRRISAPPRQEGLSKTGLVSAVGVPREATIKRQLPQGCGNGLFGEAPHPSGRPAGRLATMTPPMKGGFARDPEGDSESRL